MMRVRNDTDDHRSMIYGSGIYPNTHTHTHMDSNQKKKKKMFGLDDQNTHTHKTVILRGVIDEPEMKFVRRQKWKFFLSLTGFFDSCFVSRIFVFQ